ncbi:TPA: hypothetical protein HA243_02715 [Candidatus Micrarchaeota archaeon]|nr:hypothetical protein [Candidatus Micrarchaeota archaeon]
MRVLVFGNPVAERDSSAVKIADMLEGKLAGIEFVRFDTAEDLEKEGSEVAIMDAVAGLRSPRLISLEELELPEKPLTLHGFDLMWNLLLLKKLGKIKKAVIIGVPASRPVKESLPKVRRLLEKLEV